MRNWSYFAVLAGCLVGAGWLEVGLRTRVARRAGRLVLTLLPVVAVFCAWDAYAISRGHWWFDPEQTTGFIAVAGIPIEEVAFFIVIPICAVLTLEGVRSVTGWQVGDEG
jgi:lycopene cyclase domain-containing protein